MSFGLAKGREIEPPMLQKSAEKPTGERTAHWA